ncbi:MAG: Transglutaminase-like superfamily protein [Pseudonocardiales bacterium]|nr:Transglutaminase-like superfamily protein [Pseudonocardiales bacterium]
MIRRLVPFTLLPLAIVANGIASAPWLRAFPSSVLAAPLFGAAVLSVLIPIVVARLAGARLWITVLADLAALVLYELLVVLKKPDGFGDLVTGIWHGPAQVLTFALPLVSPPTLLVAPVALCWLAGAIAGECLARRWYTALPFGGWLVAFGLSYAGTVRAGTGSAHDARVADTWLALALLATLLLLRVAQTWVRQDASAEPTQPDGALPLRGLAVGTATTVIVALAAAAAVQSSAFAGRTTAPQRVPSVDQSHPVSPIAFISGLRPPKPGTAGQPVFHVSVDQTSPRYFEVANVDYYDGDGWSFQRSFRPSGGILPADRDPALDVAGPAVRQHYSIDRGPLASAPWMPYLDRPQKVTGTEVNIDAASGMIVPSTMLRDGAGYTVQSHVPVANFVDVSSASLPATSAPPIDTQLPGPLRVSLAKLVTTFGDETGTSTSPPVPFLQALAKDLQRNYALAGAPTTSRSRTATPSTSARERIGGVGFADVLASVIGPQRSATPEQYATLFTLVARQLGVPARLVTGFRVPSPSGGVTLTPGTYTVTTADAWTWVEIPLRGGGWVVVDPSPSTYSGAEQQASASPSPSQTPSAAPTRNALITRANGGHAVAPKSTVPHKHGATRGPLMVLLAIAAGVLIVLVLLGAVLRKRLRVRRRRRLPDPRRRLLGAWHESLDVLTESGLPDLTNLTSAEIATATGERFGDEPAAQAQLLGRAANTAVYTGSVAVTPVQADAAWQAHATLRRLVRRQLSPRARLVAGLRFHRSLSRTVIGPASWAEAGARGKRPRRGRHR